MCKISTVVNVSELTDQVIIRKPVKVLLGHGTYEALVSMAGAFFLPVHWPEGEDALYVEVPVVFDQNLQ